MIEPDHYCREIEAYLCRKNDGHLIRIVGPAFEQVSGWAREGIPVNVACAGVDRYFERYYRKGPRRRPVRIEFCEADVRDAFDAWRRAVGVQVASATAVDTDAAGEASSPRRPSLAVHVERTVARLTALRGSSRIAGTLDESLERAVRQLDALRPEASRARGDARERLIEEILRIERDLRSAALDALDEPARQAVEREAHAALEPFRQRMAPEAYQHACQAALERAVRDRFGLPAVAFE